MQCEDGERIDLPALRYAKCFQDQPHRALFRKAELKQVQAHEGGEEEPVFTVKNRTCFNTQSQAEEDEEAGNCMNPVSYNHGNILVVDRI